MLVGVESGVGLNKVGTLWDLRRGWVFGFEKLINGIHLQRQMWGPRLTLIPMILVAT